MQRDEGTWVEGGTGTRGHRNVPPVFSQALGGSGQEQVLSAGSCPGTSSELLPLSGARFSPLQNENMIPALPSSWRRERVTGCFGDQRGCWVGAFLLGLPAAGQGGQVPGLTPCQSLPTSSSLQNHPFLSVGQRPERAREGVGLTQ